MIKLYVYTSSNAKYDITNMTSSVTWSGDENTLARKLEVDIVNTDNIPEGDTLVNINVGNLVIFYSDGKEIFRGYVFQYSIDDTGKASFTAYDELVYTTKNTTSMLVKNKSASDVIISLFKKFEISIGKIESTGYKIKKLVLEEKTVADIVSEVLSETKKNNGKSYKMYSKKGKVYMTSRENATKLTVSIDNVLSASKDWSIEDTFTAVTVTKGSLETDKKDKDAVKFSSYTTKNSSKSKKYGLMTHVENVDDKTKYDAMKRKAKSLLKSLSKVKSEMKISFIGNTLCTTGNLIEIKNEMTSISGKYYISSDSHVWSEGTYKMDLQLSTSLS